MVFDVFRVWGAIIKWERGGKCVKKGQDCCGKDLDCFRKDWDCFEDSLLCSCRSPPAGTRDFSENQKVQTPNSLIFDLNWVIRDPD